MFNGQGQAQDATSNNIDPTKSNMFTMNQPTMMNQLVQQKQMMQKNGNNANIKRKRRRRNRLRKAEKWKQ